MAVYNHKNQVLLQASLLIEMRLICPLPCSIPLVCLLLLGWPSDSAGCADVMLAATKSGPDTTCSDTSLEYAHFWPLGDSTGCHGWRATASGEEVHDNSANNIRCSDDGQSLLYDQFAGNIDCSGTATSKSFALGECHQGVPPVLYDTALNLDCCNDPGGDSCMNSFFGQPYASSQATSDEVIFWNGVECTDGGEVTTSTATATTATWTTYADDACTTPCPSGSVEACSTTVDTTKDCNQNSESSQSDVKCYADKITYKNYPNTGTNSGSAGCPSDVQSFDNEIAVGQCVYFGGPVPTWKKIEADSYECEHTDDGDDPTSAPSEGPASAASANSLFLFKMWAAFVWFVWI